MSPRSGAVVCLDAAIATGGDLDALAGEIAVTCVRPLNALQLAALLETSGVTDTVARRRYEEEDVFALAERVMTRLPELHTEPASPRAAPATPAEAVWQTYLRGPLGLLPMVLLSLIIAVYQGFGAWGPQEVIILSFSMVGSLLVTGGFVQAATRKGLSYLSQGYVRGAIQVTARVMLLGLLAVLLTAALLSGSALLFQLVSVALLPLLVVSFFSLSLLWLASAVLAMLKGIHWFGIGLGIGGGVSYTLLRLLSRLGWRLNDVMLTATALGLLTALSVMGWAAWQALERESRSSLTQEGKKRMVLTPSSQLVVNLAPYFGYGVLYVLFIISGHVVGWMGHLPEGLTRVEALARVEMGLTLALCAYILTGGVAERTMTRFWERVQPYQRATKLYALQEFNGQIVDFYRQERARFIHALLLCNLLVVLFGFLGWWIGSRTGWALLTWSRHASLIAGFGLAGYALLALGVFNSMFMITLSRPGAVLPGLLLGMAATLLVGWVLGQLAGYVYATLSIPVGSLVFLWASRHRLQQLLSRADYYYYASF